MTIFIVGLLAGILRVPELLPGARSTNEALAAERALFFTRPRRCNSARRRLGRLATTIRAAGNVRRS